MALTKVSGDFIKAGSVTQAHLHSSHGITTSHLTEGDKLFFTNARVDSRIGSLSSSDLSEGTNLYYTDARARAAISGTGSLSYNSTTGVMSFTMPAQNTSNITEGSNLYYTDARADARVALIVDSAPGTLNTLNELAAALGDDASFSTTVTNSIATKLPLAGGTLTGALSGTSAAFTGNVTGANLNISNWDTAYGWGNHASAGYLTSYTEADTLATVTGRGASTSNNIAINAGASYPLQTSSSQRYGIQIRNTNNTVNSAYGWWWGTDTNFDMFFHCDGGSDRFTLTRQGEATAFASMSAPIYYDRNDTAYYVNPASRSNIGDLDLNSGAVWDATTQGTGKGALHLDPNSATDHAGAAITFGASDHSNGQAADAGIYIRSDGSYGTKMYFSTTDSYATGSQTAMNILENGQVNITRNNLIVNSDVRGTIFYDSANTAQFINPGGSTSRMLGFLKIGNSSTYNTDDGNWGTRLQVASTVHARIDVAQDANAMRSTWYCHTGNAGSHFGTTTAHHQYLMSHNATRQTLFSGYSQEGGSYRAPIFYDSNDTTYNINPNSQSSLWGVAIRGDQNSTSTENQIFFWGGGNSTTSAIGFKSNGGYFTNPTGNGDGYNTYLTMDTAGRGWVFRQGNGGTNFTSLNNSGWILNNGIWQANASMRAPIFYDSNNTGYYVDPASTSRLLNLDFGVAGYYLKAGDWGTRQQTPYGWIQLGPANTSHAHIYTDRSNFYFNQQIQLNGGSLINTNDIRAGVFYDVNDSSFYCDPSSTSYLSKIWTRGATTGNAAPRWDTSFHVAQSQHFYGHNATQTLYFGESNPAIFGSTLTVAGVIDANGGHGGIDITNTSILSSASSSWTGNPSGAGKIQYHSNRWYIVSDSSSNRIVQFRRDGSDKSYIDNDGRLMGAPDLRVPTYYDTNTAYYGDFDSTTRVNNISCAGGLIFPDNYGVGVTGLYSASRIQTIFNMGAAYKVPNDGASTANAYGLYWSHQNAGSTGGANNLASHGIIILEAGSYKGSWGGGRLVTPGDIRGSQFYDYNNTGYYVDPASTTVVNDFRCDIMYDKDSTGYYIRPGSTSITNDFRATLFYARENTTYYTRPHTSSYINSLTTAGQIQVGASGSSLLYIGGTSGNYFRFHTNNADTYFDMNCGNIHWRQGSSTRFIFYTTTANMTVYGTVTQHSDLRIKDNVVEIPNCIDKVKSIRGIYYNRTDFNTEPTKIGVVAQEVEVEMPELVHDEETSGIKSVSYTELTAVLVNAIKEQQTIIDDLKSRLETLENQ